VGTINGYTYDRTDRLHPATIETHRHSVSDIVSQVKLDLSRDLEEENPEKSCSAQQMKSPRAKAGLPTSFSEVSLSSLTDARRRVLARLAGSRSPPPESERRALPRKLDPIYSPPAFIYDDDDDDHDNNYNDNERVVFTFE